MKNIVTILDLGKNIILNEMERIGVHRTGISIMAPKADFRIVKIKGVPVTSANIIKQDMLSAGGEVAVAWGAVNHSIKKTDVLIFGTISQHKSLISKLKRQYPSLKALAAEIEEALKNDVSIPHPIRIGGRTFYFGKRTYIMGILNVTPDSFSDGGRFIKFEDAVEQGRKMIAEGADIIDIGGESTRPGALPVSAAEEIRRAIPVIKELSKIKRTVISIDTAKSKVAEAAIRAGASLINDVSALNFDRKMPKVAARYKVPIILMHMQGKPRTMQKNPRYDDLMPEIISYLQNSIGLAIKGGVPKENIIVDPGFGFGKSVEHNLEILRRLRELKVLGHPIMIGTSRKSTIGQVLGLPPDERIEGTAATVAVAVMNGANIVRVHDVAQMAKTVKMCDAIRKG